MCIVSMVHDYGSKLPQDTWTLPDALPAFEDIVKKASEFDRIAKQPECFDPEKLKFLEEIIAKQGKRPVDSDVAEIERLKCELAERDKAVASLQLEVQDTLHRAKRSEALLAAVSKANLELKDEHAADAKRHADLVDDHADLILAYVRLAADAGLKVAACGSGEHFTQLDVELPTGPVRFYVDNVYASLLAGLPYGISDTKGAYERETQNLRLTGAFHPDIDQALIPEPMTPDRVLSILDPTPAANPAPPLDLSHIRFGVPQGAPQPVDASALAVGDTMHGTTT